MAIHNSLVLGKGVRGTFGKQITFTHYKGIPIAKTPSITPYKNTPAQQKSRNAFKFLIDEWNKQSKYVFSRQAYYMLGQLTAPKRFPLNQFLHIYMPIVLADITPTFFYDVHMWRENGNLNGYGYVSTNETIIWLIVDRRARVKKYFGCKPVNHYWGFQIPEPHSTVAVKGAGGFIYMGFLVVCYLIDLALDRYQSFPYPWTKESKKQWRFKNLLNNMGEIYGIEHYHVVPFFNFGG